MKMQLVSEHWLHFQYVPKNKEVSLLKNIYFPEEDIVEDDLFYICFMLEKVARFVKKPTSYIVKQIGEKNLYHLLSCAQALHCDNPEKVAREWVNDYAIQEGNFIFDEKYDAIDTGKRDSKNILEQLKNDEDYVQGILRYFCK